MGRILRTYVIKEVVLPSMLAMLTLTFVLLIGVVYDLINLLLQPGVGVGQVGAILFDFLPSMLVFATPMALLIGVLIGVGRMVLDREILAIRASGIQIFSIFYPLIIVALLLSGVIMFLSGTLIPRLLLNGMERISGLQFAIASSLEPGRFHEKLGGGKNDFTLYFRERDPKDQAMKAVMLKWEESVKLEQPDKAALDSSTVSRATAAMPSQAPTTSTAQVVQNVKAAIHSSSTTASQASVAPAKTKDKVDKETKDKKDKKDTKDKSEQAKDEDEGPRDTQLTLVDAESGSIVSKVQDVGDGDEQKASIVLSLQNGSIHRLNPDPASKDYVVIRFKKLEKKLFENATIKKRHKTRTNSELRELVAQDRDSLDKKARSEWGTARRELVERRAISLASFVFALIGIPLAIWLRPSGKSWGILLAIVLMLVYYILMKMGLTMVEADKPLGVLLAFAPNLLYVLLGAGLWWHAIRS